MNTREEFERWYDEELYARIDYGKRHSAWLAWQEQQKKIDEGHRKIEAQYNMIKSIQAYGEAQQKTINELQLKLDIKDDAMRGYQLVIKHLQENIK